MVAKIRKKRPLEETLRPLTATEERELATTPEPTVIPDLHMTRALTAELVIDADNANDHPGENIAAIRASLEAFGQVQPLVVQRSTKRVIAGNARLAVMRELGWTHVNVIELDLEDDRAIALGLADNRTAKLARWNAAKVLELVGRLEADAPNLAATVGFDDTELAKLTNIAAKEEQLALDAIAGGAEADDDTPSLFMMNEDNWGSPSWVIDLVHRFLGTAPDLDPASDEKRNQVVRAKRWLGLANVDPASGIPIAWGDARTVFVNPPGGKHGRSTLAQVFWRKAVEHHKEHGATIAWFAYSISQLQTLQNADADAMSRTHLCVFRNRIAFEDREGQPKNGMTIPSAFFVLSPNRDVADRFERTFGDHGSIWRASK